MATLLREEERSVSVPGVILVIAGSFALYLLTLSRNYAADALDYVLFVESGSLRLLVDIYHLLLAPLGWLFFKMWQAAGWQESAMLPLQILNAAGGAVSAGLLYALASELAHSRRIATLVAAGFAVSGAQWLLSTEAEFVTIPLAASLLVLWVLLSASEEKAARRRTAFLSGALLALAVLTYASALILVPVISLIFGRALPGRPDLARQQTMRVVMPALAIVAVAYLALIALPQLGFGTMLWSLTGGSSYAEVRLWDLAHGGYALLRSLLVFPTIGLNSSSAEFLSAASTAVRVAFGVYYLAVAMLFALPPVMLSRRRDALQRQQVSALLALLLWAALSALFAFIWVPGDLTFWLPVLAVWWLLVAALGSTLTLPEHHWQFTAVLLIVALGLMNGSFLIVPKVDASRNAFLTAAAVVRENTTAGDLLLIDPHDDWQLYYYLSSFAQRQVAFIGDEGEAAEWAGDGQWERIFVVGADADGAAATQGWPPGAELTPAAWSTQALPVWLVVQQ